MRRRRILAGTIPLLSAAAGCVGGTGQPRGSPDTATREQPTRTDDRTDSGDGASGSDASTTPAPASDVFAGMDCPGFDETADRTVCYHAVDPSTADVLVGVHPEVFDPNPGDGTVETLVFTLYNRSTRPFLCNPYGWGIERFDDGDWTHVAPDAHPEPLVEVPPEGTYAWELPSAPHPSPREDRRMRLDVALQAGVYAFHVTGWFAAGSNGTVTSTDEPPETRIECVSLFRLDDDVDPSTSGATPRPTATGTVDDG